MKKLIIITLLLITCKAGAQNYILKPGDKFPGVIIGPIINAPVTQLNLSTHPSNKLFIINFWGTWCSPCLPEMDSLAKLQAQFKGQIQIIGLSDDPINKLKKYLAKKPSKIWLASDTSSLLYQMLNLASVGQCIVINSKHEIVALLQSESVNAKTISRLIKGEKVKSNGETKNRLNVTNKDPFGVDSLLTSNFTVRGYMKDQGTMGRRYANGIYGGRRVSYFNINVEVLYKDAYGIVSEKQVVYEGRAKKYSDYKNKDLLYCFDLLVTPAQKDNLHIIMQQKLQAEMPVKGRIEMRDVDVYILKLKDAGKIIVPKSKQAMLVYEFDGRGFDGKGITLNQFADAYLSNEFDLPVINETGLEGLYDIKTNIELRSQEGVHKSIDDIGFSVTKARRKIKTLILYTE
nr:redoxin domain-containing protein [uncultured Mucilaginibacter sp.]